MLPNHFHFIIQQNIDGEISRFMQKLGMGYTNYFNNKHRRSGYLFQSKFKAIYIKDYSYLLKLLVYVNCNYEIHGLGKKENWIWSSFLDCVGKRNGTLCNLEFIEEEFKDITEFKFFCTDIIPDIKLNKEIEQYLLE